MIKLENMKESNKLIAEFMGYTHQSDSEFKDENGFWNDFEVFETWDWLMPVVQKCLDISNDEMMEDFYSIQNVMPNIDATYKAVVEFIKWYNKQ